MTGTTNSRKLMENIDGHVEHVADHLSNIRKILGMDVITAARNRSLSAWTRATTVFVKGVRDAACVIDA